MKGYVAGLHHLAICVHDLPKAKTFYGEMLGLKELPRPDDVAEQFSSAWYLLGNAELHVVENKAFQPLASQPGPHFAVAPDDFEATVERLRSNGIRFAFGPAKGPDGVDRVVVVDPTGNVVEIADLPLHQL
ncbi:MAG: VOC family protein [Halioglobus sp.]